MSTNSFDALFSQQRQTAPPPAPVAAPTSTGANPFDQMFGGGSSTQTAQPETIKAPKGNSFDNLFGGSAKAPQSDENESPLSQAWSWANKPLLDLHREGAGGFEAGAEDVLSGLTSPLSIALTVGTLGSGTALRATGLTAKELPVAVQGLKFLTEVGFTAQQAYGVIQESPRVLDALKEGDYETAKRLGVHVLANLGGAALGASKALPEAGELAERSGFITPKNELAAVRNELGTYQLDVERAGSNAAALEKAAREGLENPASLPGNDETLPLSKMSAKERATTLGGISRFIEADGDKDVLAQRQKALEASSDVKENYSTKDRQQLLDKYEAAQNLTPEQEDFAKRIRESLENDLERGYQRGIIRTAVENYISHVGKMTQRTQQRIE
jgi:hypothetical protein